MRVGGDVFFSPELPVAFLRYGYVIPVAYGFTVKGKEIEVEYFRHAQEEFGVDRAFVEYLVYVCAGVREFLGELHYGAASLFEFPSDFLAYVHVRSRVLVSPLRR